MGKSRYPSEWGSFRFQRYTKTKWTEIDPVLEPYPETGKWGPFSSKVAPSHWPHICKIVYNQTHEVGVCCSQQIYLFICSRMLSNDSKAKQWGSSELKVGCISEEWKVSIVIKQCPGFYTELVLWPWTIPVLVSLWMKQVFISINEVLCSHVNNIKFVELRWNWAVQIPKRSKVIKSVRS